MSGKWTESGEKTHNPVRKELGGEEEMKEKQTQEQLKNSGVIYRSEQCGTDLENDQYTQKWPM